MTFSLAGAAAVAVALAARPPLEERVLVGRLYPSVRQAVSAALVSRPVAVAFGEYHQTLATAHLDSALRRFTDQILPLLAPVSTSGAAEEAAGAQPRTALPPSLSRLVVETWVASGKCGEVEHVVTEDVRKTTQRPAATEGEIERLLRTAMEQGVAPRILSMSCADYEAMSAPPGPDPKAGKVGDQKGSGALPSAGVVPAGGAVDYDRALRITRRALEVAALSALRGRPATNGGGEAGSVAIYGGALHNDLHPDPSLAPYSFAPALMAATLGQYVEIDLVVPEFAATSPSLRAQSWWRAYRRVPRPRGNTGNEPNDQTRSVVMVRRSARSFVIVLPVQHNRH